MPLEFTTSKTDGWVLGLFALCVYIAPTLSIVATVLYVSPSTTIAVVIFTMGSLAAWLLTR